MRSRSLLLGLCVMWGLTACSNEYSHARGTFMSGCVSSGAAKSVCTCTFDKLVAQYSAQTLEDLNRPDAKPSDELLKSVVHAAIACQAE